LPSSDCWFHTRPRTFWAIKSNVKKINLRLLIIIFVVHSLELRGRLKIAAAHGCVAQRHLCDAWLAADIARLAPRGTDQLILSKMAAATTSPEGVFINEADLFMSLTKNNHFLS
jgi:hypothetical protein